MTQGVSRGIPRFPGCSMGVSLRLLGISGGFKGFKMGFRGIQGVSEGF